MEGLTIAQAKEIVSSYQEVQDKYAAIQKTAEDFFWKMYRASKDFRSFEVCNHYPRNEFLFEPNILQVSILEQTISVSCEAPACERGCCGYESHTFRFPLAYLWLNEAEVLADLKRLQEAIDLKKQLKREKALKNRKRSTVVRASDGSVREIG